MKKIFIDTENVQNYNCLKSLNLTEKDEIILFFSQNIKSFKVDDLNLILSFGCKIKSILVKVRGNNSLDFHIITNLCLNYSTENKYYIVSNDKGYKSSIDQFSLLGYSNVHILKWSNSKSKSKSKSKINQNDLSLVNNDEELEIKKIYKSSKNKCDFHTKLCKRFGMKGQKIYKQFKSGL